MAKIFVPGFDDREAVKAFCKRHSLSTKHLDYGKWSTALKAVDLPERGGLLDEQRLKLFGAVLKS